MIDEVFCQFDSKSEEQRADEDKDTYENGSRDSDGEESDNAEGQQMPE